jgi:hypothetical protein
LCTLEPSCSETHSPEAESDWTQLIELERRYQPGSSLNQVEGDTIFPHRNR